MTARRAPAGSRTCRHPIVVLLVLAGTAAADPPSAFVIDAKQFERQVERVAVAPVAAPHWMGVPADQIAEADAAIAATLTKAGFEVVASSEFAAIEARLTRYAGGLVRPDGSIDPDRQRVVQEHTVREMLRLHRFDALVLPRIVRRDVPWADDRVEWDGVSRRVEHEGGGKFGGKIAVASLEVRFVDRSERPLYLGYGGLEPLMLRDREKLEPLPPDRLWRDRKRIGKAVGIALAPL